MKEIIMSDEHWEDVEPGTEALIEEWHINDGDEVVAGQVIANIVVVKTSIELTTPVDGLVEKIMVKSEETFSKGTMLVTIVET